MEWVVDTGCTGDRGDIQPDGPGKQGRRHHPDEHLRVANHLGIDNAALDGADHVATGNQCASRLEDTCDDDGASQCERLCSHRRSDIVGNVVGADVHRHVAADHGGYNQRVAHLATKLGDKDNDAYDKENCRAEAEHFHARS